MSVSIGILAGMGPRSTAPFIDSLVTECQKIYGAKHDMDFPKMHIISLPTPFWPGHKIDDTAMIAHLKQGIKDLVTAKVSLISIPCNLAHCYFPEILAASDNIPVLHIAKSAIDGLPNSVRRVALLATEPTLDAGFYQQRLHTEGKVVIDSEELRSLTTMLIQRVKGVGYKEGQVQELWQQMIVIMQQQDVDAVLIACTDLSPLADKLPTDWVVIDTAASLASATIRRYRDVLSFNSTL